MSGSCAGFSDAWHDASGGASQLPASEKRQGTKSRPAYDYHVSFRLYFLSVEGDSHIRMIQSDLIALLGAAVRCNAAHVSLADSADIMVVIVMLIGNGQ